MSWKPKLHEIDFYSDSVSRWLLLELKDRGYGGKDGGKTD